LKKRFDYFLQSLFAGCLNRSVGAAFFAKEQKIKINTEELKEIIRLIEHDKR
jgi:hypothetical protein